jgi:hypothetical protein
MYRARRRVRLGFTGLELLFPLLILVLIFSAIAKMCAPGIADAQHPKSASASAGTAATVKETAAAGTALMRLSKESTADAPIAVSAPDPTVVDPSAVAPTSLEPGAGFDLGDLLEGLLDLL